MKFPLCEKLGLQLIYSLPDGDKIIFAKDLEHILEKSLVVYSHEVTEPSTTFWDYWTTLRHSSDTHVARLLMIEPLEKKECEHEPSASPVVSYTMVPAFSSICKHCGVKLKIKWEV